MNRGKLVITAMVLVGLALSSFAWWNRWSRSRRVIDLWGPEAALAIRTGKTVELLWLADTAADGAGDLPAATQLTGVERVEDISHAPGLIHARHQLLQQAAFDWKQPRQGDHQPRWTQALRFRRGEDTATLLLDFRNQRVLLLERNREASMQPIAAALKRFLGDIKPAGPSRVSTPANSQ